MHNNTTTKAEVKMLPHRECDKVNLWEFVKQDLKELALGEQKKRFSIPENREPHFYAFRD